MFLLRVAELLILYLTCHFECKTLWLAIIVYRETIGIILSHFTSFLIPWPLGKTEGVVVQYKRGNEG